MIKKRIGNKIILATIAGMLVLTGMGISESVSSAANTSDTKWEAVLDENSTQAKIYIYWSLTYGSGLSAISVGVYGCTGDSAKKYPAGRLDGDRKRFYGINGMGKYAMTNYVNELKYSYAKLGFKSLSGSGVAKGVWSPDCAGSYTVLK